MFAKQQFLNSLKRIVEITNLFDCQIYSCGLTESGHLCQLFTRCAKGKQFLELFLLWFNKLGDLKITTDCGCF